MDAAAENTKRKLIARKFFISPVNNPTGTSGNALQLDFFCNFLQQSGQTPR